MNYDFEESYMRTVKSAGLLLDEVVKGGPSAMRYGYLTSERGGSSLPESFEAAVGRESTGHESTDSSSEKGDSEKGDSPRYKERDIPKPRKETDPNSKLVVAPKKFQWPEFTSTEKRHYPKSIEIIEEARRKWEAGDSSERTKLMAQSTPYTLSMRLFGRRNAGADEGARYAQSTDPETVAASEWAHDPAFYRQGHGPNAGLTPLARQVLEQVGRRGMYWDDKSLNELGPWYKPDLKHWTARFRDNLRRRWKEQPVIRWFHPNSYSPYDWEGRPDFNAIQKILGTSTGFGTLPVATE